MCKIPILKLSKEKHIFLQFNLCNDLFIQWRGYDPENVVGLTPNSNEG